MIDYKQLDVWIASRQLANSIYTISKNFPKDEIFGLPQQIRKSAISIPSNIAEGIGRNHLMETTQFLYIARGSLFELETQIYIASDQGNINATTLEQITDDIEKCKKLLNGFISYYLKKKHEDHTNTKH
jgi:four helix bundle protein